MIDTQILMQVIKERDEVIKQLEKKVDAGWKVQEIAMESVRLNVELLKRIDELQRLLGVALGELRRGING